MTKEKVLLNIRKSRKNIKKKSSNLSRLHQFREKKIFEEFKPIDQVLKSMKQENVGVGDVKLELPQKTETITNSDIVDHPNNNNIPDYESDESVVEKPTNTEDQNLSQLFQGISLTPEPMEVSFAQPKVLKTGLKRSALDTSSLINTTVQESKRQALNFGPLSSKYYNNLIREKDNDVSYGPKVVDTDNIRIGNKHVTFNTQDEIIIGDKSWKGTEGLFELICKKHPINFNENDLANYYEILVDTSAHLNSANKIKSNNGYKYMNIIRPLYEKYSKRGGSLNMKLNNKKVEYVYYDTPDELVDRLRLLVADKEAGNNSHDNEIYSILEELQELKIIKGSNDRIFHVF